MAPVIRTLRADSGFNVNVLCSGQHRDLLAPLAQWFELGFDEDLRVMSDNQSLGELTARLMQARIGGERVYRERERPSAIVLPVVQ